MQTIAPQITQLHLPGPTSANCCGRHVRLSVPFARGANVPVDLQLAKANCAALLSQTRKLGSDTADGPTWLHCEAIATEAGAYQLLASNAATSGSPDAIAQAQAITNAEQPGQVTLTNGLLQLELSAQADQPVAQLLMDGQSILADDSLTLKYTSEGRAFRGEAARDRSIEVTAQGPARAAVDLHGRFVGPKGEDGLRYRLRFDMLAGVPGLVVSFWFFHDLPGLATHSVDSLSLTFNLRQATGDHHVIQTKFGLTEVPRPVTTREPMDARVGHDGATRWRLIDAAPLNDPTEYPSYQMPPLDEVGQWFGATLANDRWIAMTADDLDAMLPKGMRIGDGAISLDVWPDWAPTGPMVLPQGRSRSVTARLALGSDTDVMHSAADHVFTASRPTTLLLPAELYAQAGVMGVDEMLPRHCKDARRFDGYLTRVACPPTVADMFDLGDTPDPGYQRTYTATGRRVAPIVPADQVQPIQYEALGHHAVTAWSDIQQYEQVWANNEYDVIWAIAGEAMRSRNASLLTPLQWYARHAIEVDFVHHSDDRWKHRNTPPHCTGHTSAGGYPSHVWTEGVLGYYALTGDEDALAFARAIADKVLEFFTDPDQRSKLWKPTRELGWGLLAVAGTAEFDRQAKYVDMSRDIADMLIATELDNSFMSKVVAGAFGYASLSLGVDKLHNLCPEAKYRDWLIALARAYAPYAAGEREQAPGSIMGLCILHAGYRHCGDEALLNAGMHVVERMLDSRAWFEPSPYTKPFAMLHRPLSRFFRDAADKGLLAELDYRF